jgi:hypothetical protein
VAGLHADRASILCGNIQRSNSSDYEQCGMWIYWARYGQYLFYVNTYQDAMSAAEFTDVVRPTCWPRPRRTTSFNPRPVPLS